MSSSLSWGDLKFRLELPIAGTNCLHAFKLFAEEVETDEISLITVRTWQCSECGEKAETRERPGNLLAWRSGQRLAEL